MDLGSGGPGFVTIYGRRDEEDAKFWDAVRMIKEALDRDLDQYCALSCEPGRLHRHPR